MSEKKVLVIDDAVIIQRLLSFTLEKEGYHVQIAKNGQEGIDKARLFKPDVIFTDIMMPIKDGFQVCRELREDPELNDVFIIILTARGQFSDAEKGLAAGANEYLIKPFDPAKVIEKIKQL